MKLVDVIEKLKIGEEVTAEMIALVKGIDEATGFEKATAELKAEKGKNASIVEDKHKFKTRAEEAEQALEDIKTEKLPEAEKMQKRLEKLEATNAEVKAELEKERHETATKERDNKLLKLSQDISWIKEMPKDTGLNVVKQAFKDVEDFDDDIIKETMSKITESHKGLIETEAAGGSGGVHNHGGNKQEDAGKPKSFLELQNEAFGNK